MRLSLKILIYAMIALWLNACTNNTIDPPTELKPLNNSKSSHIIWQQKTRADSQSYNKPLPPQVWQQQIYLASFNGYIQVYDLKTGQILWEKDTDMILSASPGVGEGKILIGSNDGTLLVLNASNGEEIWRKQMSSEILSPAQINANIIILRTNNNRLTALNADDGSELWHYQSSTPSLSLRGNSAPLLKNDRVFAGFDNGQLVSLDSLSGKSHWKIDLAQARGRSDLERMIDIDAALSWADKTLYVSSYQGRTVALDPFNNEVIWQNKQATHLNLAIDDSAVYLTTATGNVRSLERETGNTLWQQSGLLARLVSAPAVNNNKIAVADFEGYVHWLNKDDGSFYSRIRVAKSPIRSLIATTEGILSLNNAGQLNLINP